MFDSVDLQVLRSKLKELDTMFPGAGTFLNLGVKDYKANIVKAAQLSAELMSDQLHEKFGVPRDDKMVKVLTRLFLMEGKSSADEALLGSKLEDFAKVWK